MPARRTFKMPLLSLRIACDEAVVAKPEPYSGYLEETKRWMIDKIWDRIQRQHGFRAEIKRVHVEFQPHLWEDTERMKVSIEYVKS